MTDRLSDADLDRTDQAGREHDVSGWAETPGGGLLARLIGEAFARATDEREDEDDEQ